MTSPETSLPLLPHSHRQTPLRFHETAASCKFLPSSPEYRYADDYLSKLAVSVAS